MAIRPKLMFWEAIAGDQNEQNDICPKCGRTVYRSMLRLRGRNWHSACFQCVKCEKVLNLLNFSEFDNDIFCSECYAESFTRPWRCKEQIDTRRLSKQLKNVVMDGLKYRWCPPNDKDSFDSTSFHTAPSTFSQELSGESRRTDDSTESSTVDETDSDPSENEIVRPRSQIYAAVDRSVLIRPSDSRTPCIPPPRLMRQSLRGRMTASEGVPEKRYLPRESVPDETQPVSDDEAKVVEFRLRDAPPRLAPRTGSMENMRRIAEMKAEWTRPKIYSILETSEDFGATDSVDSLLESSSSEEKPPQPTVPPKPQRRSRRSVELLPASALPLLTGDTTRDQEPRVPPMKRNSGVPFVRHSRFPSDHLSALSRTDAEC